jgi:CRP-like cAMP-binding protein
MLLSRGWLAAQPPALQQAILLRGGVRHVPAGSTIFEPGDRPDGIYAVVTGQLKLVYNLPDGRQVVLWAAEPGFWFGIRDLFARDAVRYGAAVATGTATVFHLPAKGFAEITAEDPRYFGNFAAIMSYNLLLALRYISEVLSQPTTARVARMLALLCETAGAGKAGSYDLDISQQDLADMLGLSRVTVSKALQKLRSEGLIALHYGRIAVPVIARLAIR